MSDLKQILDEEIRRVARKEIKQILTPVLAKMSEMRKIISAQEKIIREAQKHGSLPTVSEKAPASESTDADAAAAKVPRITKARIVKLRNKSGLSHPNVYIQHGMASAMIVEVAEVMVIHAVKAIQMLDRPTGEIQNQST